MFKYQDLDRKIRQTSNKPERTYFEGYKFIPSERPHQKLIFTTVYRDSKGNIYQNFVTHNEMLLILDQFISTEYGNYPDSPYLEDYCETVLKAARVISYKHSVLPILKALAEGKYEGA